MTGAQPRIRFSKVMEIRRALDVEERFLPGAVTSDLSANKK